MEQQVNLDALRIEKARRDRKDAEEHDFLCDKLIHLTQENQALKEELERLKQGNDG